MYCGERVLSSFCIRSLTGNYTGTLNDTKLSVGLRPSFLKAFLRGKLAIVPSSKFSGGSRGEGGAEECGSPQYI